MNCKSFNILILLSAMLATVFCAAQQGPVEAPGAGVGTTVRFLTHDVSTVDNWPCFSPDGKNVLFSRSRDGGITSQLYLVPLSGGEPRSLTDDAPPVSATQASWSANGNVIAFTGKSRDRKTSIWTINGDGSNAHQLDASGLSDEASAPAWYPDGGQLMVADTDVLKRVDTQHGRATALTDRAKVLATTPNVAPDGQSIAFTGRLNSTSAATPANKQIWLIDEKGIAHRLGNTDIAGNAPSWSPDGQWLAFESNRSAKADLTSIYIVKRDGTHLRQLTDYELNATHPIWSPDGQSLVVSARFVRGKVRTGIALVELPSDVKK